MLKVQYKVGPLEMAAEGSREVVEKEVNAFMDFVNRIGTRWLIQMLGPVPAGTPAPITPHPVEVQPGMEWDVVAIYDNAGIPSIMHRFRKTTNKELFGGSDKVHPAFKIGGKIYDEIYISVYPNCNINGKPYSLPYQQPWTNITNDDAAEACFSKGEGWHMMTAPEWGLLANLSLKNGTLPHGNTDYGKYHGDPTERGENYDNYRTLTGSGPATWTHNHTPEGVHDLCGNVWEMLRGLRIVDGNLQAAQDNDAALPETDLTRAGDGWLHIVDSMGRRVRVSVGDDKITIHSDDSVTLSGYDGCPWEKVQIMTNAEQLKELALYGGEPNAYCYIDSTEGEYFPLRGGIWSSGAHAGVFCAGLSYARSISPADLGFRSAYFRKTDN